MTPPGRYGEAGLVEEPALDQLEELGWGRVNAFGEVLGPAGTLGRDSIHEVFLVHRLRDAVVALNPDVSELTREEALAALAKDRLVMDRVRANREVHDLLRDGYRAEWIDDRSDKQFASVRSLDFGGSSRNDWLVLCP